MNGKTKRNARPRIHQAELSFGGRGGRREGAGRPKANPEAASHAKRPPLSRHHPVHVTLRIERGLPRLRRGAAFRALRASFASGCERSGFRLVHYSVQSNHLHLLVEGDDRRALSRGLQGLAVRMARALNRLWRRTGSVFAERYHEHVLRTPLEVRRALVYVIQNARKHGAWRKPGAVDPLSSGEWFDGWRERASAFVSQATSLLALARTWLLRIGWRWHELIGLSEVPRHA